MNIALLGLAISCLSVPALLVRLARAPNEAIGFWRLTTVVILLAPLAWGRRGSWAALPAFDRKSTFGAGLLFFIHLWTFVYSAQHTTIAHCMIAFSTHPLWTGLGARLFFGEAITGRLLRAYALAALGVWALFSGSHTGGGAGLLGDAAGLLSALSFSGYVLAGKGARRKLDNSVFAFLCSLVMAACFLAVGAARGIPMTGYPGVFWAAVAGLAVITSLGGHALFTHLLAVMDVNLLSCAKLLEIPLSALGAWLIFGEELSGRTLASFALVSAAVLVLMIPSPGAPRADPAELEE